MSEKVEQLAYFLKKFSQQQPLPDLSFDPAYPPITAQMVNWLSNEMEYLKTRRQLRSALSVNDDGLSSEFKLDFSISVSQLACLFRIFVETGVIQNRNASELARFLSKFAKTKKSEAISYDSFRIKFYNVESGTKDAVRKMLQILLQYMNKN